MWRIFSVRDAGRKTFAVLASAAFAWPAMAQAADPPLLAEEREMVEFRVTHRPLDPLAMLAQRLGARFPHAGTDAGRLDDPVAVALRRRFRHGGLNGASKFDALGRPRLDRNPHRRNDHGLAALDRRSQFLRQPRRQAACCGGWSC